MIIQAFGKNIIVNPIYEEKKAGTLIRPDEQPIYHEVLSVGDEVKNVKIGDKLILNSYGVQGKNFKEKKYFFTLVEHIHAHLTE